MTSLFPTHPHLHMGLGLQVLCTTMSGLFLNVSAGDLNFELRYSSLCNKCSYLLSHSSQTFDSCSKIFGWYLCTVVQCLRYNMWEQKSSPPSDRLSSHHLSWLRIQCHLPSSPNQMLSFIPPFSFPLASSQLASPIDTISQMYPKGKAFSALTAANHS